VDAIVAGLQGFSAAFGRFERIQLDKRSLLTLLIKNPAGANEVVRTLVAGGTPRVLLVALNDELADGRDVSWIWDVDFEPLLGPLDRLVATGERAAELRCGSSTRVAGRRDRGAPGSRPPDGPRVDAAGRRADRPADLHRHTALRGRSATWLRQAVLGRGGVKTSSATSSRLPTSRRPW
jgi:hypothetical protein